MRVCSVCSQSGHNARTCPKGEEKSEAVKPPDEKLEKVKQAVALQNLGEKFMAPEAKESTIPDSWLEDPSFWDYDQRKLIAREFLKLRRITKKEVIVVKDMPEEFKEFPKEVVVLPHVPGKLLDIKVEKDAYLDGIMEPLKKEEIIEVGER